MASSGTADSGLTQVGTPSDSWTMTSTIPTSNRCGEAASDVSQRGSVGVSQGDALAVNINVSSVGGSSSYATQVGAKSTQQATTIPAVQAPSQPGVAAGKSKSRTSCNFCTARKKRCDYVEIGGKKQQCSLCKKQGHECVFGERPQRRSGTNQLVKAQSLVKRPRMKASSATGLVGMEENYYVADFFDRLGFYPVASERAVQRAIMDLLFQPAEEATYAVRRRHSDTERRGEGAMDKRRLSESREVGELGSAIKSMGATPGRYESELDALNGPLAVRRKWYQREESRPFSCMLWCTIALGAMTSNMCSRMVHSYVHFAEQAIDGVLTPDIPTTKAYTILSMVYAWLDKEKLFKKHLDNSIRLVEIMEENGEEVPMEVKDMIKEHLRVFALHYSKDYDVVQECCNEADEEPADVNPLFMMRDSGLFHMVRFYSDGVFKAFWRDALEKDPTLPETKRFAEKHKAQFPIIQELAMKDERLKESAGGLYIRTTMQFLRLPLDDDPADALRSSIELTKVIMKLPGAIRFGPLKHYVHCLLMGLSRAAVAGKDQGSYEKLRALYNSLDISGPAVVPAQDMEIEKLCDQRFCRCMAWAHQQKHLRRVREAERVAAAAVLMQQKMDPGASPAGSPRSPESTPALEVPTHEHQVPPAGIPLASVGPQTMFREKEAPTNVFEQNVPRGCPPAPWAVNNQFPFIVHQQPGIINPPFSTFGEGYPVTFSQGISPSASASASPGSSSSTHLHRQRQSNYVTNSHANLGNSPQSVWAPPPPRVGSTHNVGGSAVPNAATHLPMDCQPSGPHGNDDDVGRASGFNRRDNMQISSVDMIDAAHLNPHNAPRRANSPVFSPRDVLQQQERDGSVKDLGQLLLGDTFDDRDCPEIYQGESDTEDYESFVGSGVASGAGEVDNASIQSLEALLGTKPLG